MTNPETDLIHAPWSAGQVTALNAFQHHGRMHPFTCGATHASGQSPVLVATHSGWVCPDPQCVYRQDWAHAFMAEGVPVRIVTVPPTAAVSVPPPAPRADDQAALRDRAAEAIRAAACPGSDCRLSEAECSEQRIQPAAWERGVLSEVYGRPEWFADAVLAVLPEPADQAAFVAEAEAKLTAGCPDHGPNGGWLMTCQCEAIGVLRDLAAETQRECRASISGNCLRESQSETACDTEAGECVHGGQPAAEAPTTTKPETDLVEEYLRFLRGQGPEPDLSVLSPQQREAAS